jgi:hypothetical protein
MVQNKKVGTLLAPRFNLYGLVKSEQLWRSNFDIENYLLLEKMDNFKV